jgi:hypothetical protein
MTEPVHFNTEFIYRFGTDGIVSFGGKEDAIIDIDEITWNKKDAIVASYNLRKMIVDLKLDDPQIDSYEANKQGTIKLVNDLIAQDKYEKAFIMGCVICHQLKYRVPLVATFCTGQPNSDYSSDTSDNYNADSDSDDK